VVRNNVKDWDAKEAYISPDQAAKWAWVRERCCYNRGGHGIVP